MTSNWELFTVLAATDVSALLPAITAPALVILPGESLVMQPNSVRRVAALLPNAQLEDRPHGFHGLHGYCSGFRSKSPLLRSVQSVVVPTQLLTERKRATVPA